MLSSAPQPPRLAGPRRQRRRRRWRPCHPHLYSLSLKRHAPWRAVLSHPRHQAILVAPVVDGRHQHAGHGGGAAAGGRLCEGLHKQAVRDCWFGLKEKKERVVGVFCLRSRPLCLRSPPPPPFPPAPLFPLSLTLCATSAPTSNGAILPPPPPSSTRAPSTNTVASAVSSGPVSRVGRPTSALNWVRLR